MTPTPPPSQWEGGMGSPPIPRQNPSIIGKREHGVKTRRNPVRQETPLLTFLSFSYSPIHPSSSCRIPSSFTLIFYFILRSPTFLSLCHVHCFLAHKGGFTPSYSKSQSNLLHKSPPLAFSLLILTTGERDWRNRVGQ